MLDMDVIYREYADSVFRFLMTLCREECTAEELTQETFYQAVRSAHKYDGTCKVSTWLCQIAFMVSGAGQTKEKGYIHAGGKYGLRQGRTGG